MSVSKCFEDGYLHLCNCGKDLTLNHLLMCPYHKKKHVRDLKKRKNMKEITLEKLLTVGEEPTEFLNFLKDVDVYDKI